MSEQIDDNYVNGVYVKASGTSICLYDSSK